MSIRLSLVVALFAALAPMCFAQKLTSDQIEQSERILAKIRKMEIYNQVLPVLLTPEQAKAFLPIIEKHRRDADKIEYDEHKLMVGLEKELDVAIKDAQTKGTLPEAATMRNTFIHFQAFVMKRKALIDETVAELKALMRDKLNAGQVRAAANSFNPAVFGVADKDALTEEQRLDYWVRMVLIDNTAYPVLTEISQRK